MTSTAARGHGAGDAGALALAARVDRRCGRRIPQFERAQPKSAAAWSPAGARSVICRRADPKGHNPPPAGIQKREPRSVGQG
ncbi:MAG: hypothetical protein U1F77_01765 [Kiritimatiellia bacterium]